MSEVRSAIHVRTGQRELSEAVDAWLRHHAVETVALADAYDACVYLLRNYQRVPDLALIGADWLADDEFRLLTCLRQTWPRTAVLVYGATTDIPWFDGLPQVLTCRGAEALRARLADSPAELMRRIGVIIVPPGRVEQRLGIDLRSVQSAPADLPHADRQAMAEPANKTGRQSNHQGLALNEPEPPRAILTAAELSALLDLPEQD